MPKLKKFRIGVCEDHGGYMVVEAPNRDLAEQAALELVDEYGLDGMPEKYQMDITARQTCTC